MEKPRLLDQVHATCCLRHYSSRTEEAYIYWIRRYIFFHNKRHPLVMAENEIREFLSYLAVKEHVSASTQNQALNALIFLYHHVLKKALGSLGDIERAHRAHHLPTVFTQAEAAAVLAQMEGRTKLMASLLYGAGLRLLECLHLRVKDIGFLSNQIVIRNGKGFKDRITVLPQSAKEPLKHHLKMLKLLHERDLSDGFGEASMPDALERKYPNAPKEWSWQYVFPASHRSHIPGTTKLRRHHLDESVLQRAVKEAVRKAGIAKHASCHTFRHSFATHLLENGYTHVMDKGVHRVTSPLDRVAHGWKSQEGVRECERLVTWASSTSSA